VTTTSSCRTSISSATSAATVRQDRLGAEILAILAAKDQLSDPAQIERIGA